MKWFQLDFIGRLLASPKQVEASAVSECVVATGIDPAFTARGAELLHSMGCGELATRLRVYWSVRLRSTAGLAFPREVLIKLNPRLREFGESEVARTFLHELAHLVAHHRAGRRRIAPHGAEWRRACIELGVKGERRCHDLPLPRKEIARNYRYRCPACGHELRRVRPIRRPSACLACCRKHNSGVYDERFRLVKTRSKR